MDYFDYMGLWTGSYPSPFSIHFGSANDLLADTGYVIKVDKLTRVVHYRSCKSSIPTSTPFV